MINGKPGYTAAITVTDAAEVNVVAHSYCAAIYVSEQPSAVGWPRAFLIKGPMPGSVQNPQSIGGSYRFPGPFAPGDVAGTVELASAGGDTSTFNQAELSQ